MDVFRWETRPTGLTDPIMVASFRGWNDAGEGASFATSFLGSAFGATRFASVDPEGFFDFQSHRPTISVSDGAVEGPIVLPSLELHSATPPDGRSLILLTGEEPSLRWPTLCRAALDIAADLGVQDVITFGSLIADVPHTRPIRLTHMSVPRDMTDVLGTRRPDYSGPTGIVAMLHTEAVNRGMRAASLWAAVPHYIGGAPAPNATAALLRAFVSITGRDVDLSDLDEAVAEFENGVNEAVTNSPQAASMVAELERAYDADQDDQFFGEVPSGDAIAAEFERFLREQGSGDAGSDTQR